MRRLLALLLTCLVLVTCATVGAPSIVGRPPEDGHARYIIGGDSRDDSAHVLPWAFREARARDATAFFFLGDMELTPQLDEHFRAALPLLGPVPFYPALGNHEVRVFGVASIGHSEAEAAFRRRFLGTAATPVHSSIPEKVVYGVTLGESPNRVHFIALDNVSQTGFGTDQLAWLARDLGDVRQDATVKYIIVGMHKPLAKNGATKHSMDADGAAAIAESDAALALMVTYRVSMIVTSHLHAFLAFRTAGIPTYITGGLGAPLDKGGPDYAFHHFLQVDVGDDDLHVSVVRFDGLPSLGDGEDKD